jgi:hypothetical protein
MRAREPRTRGDRTFEQRPRLRAVAERNMDVRKIDERLFL